MPPSFIMYGCFHEKIDYEFAIFYFNVTMKFLSAPILANRPVCLCS
jgi:hypothetical protein